MKLCAKVQVKACRMAEGVHAVGDVELIDFSFADDAHPFGVDEDGILHIEITGADPSAIGRMP